MKKYLSFIIILVALTCLNGCQNNKGNKSNKSTYSGAEITKDMLIGAWDFDGHYVMLCADGTTRRFYGYRISDVELSNDEYSNLEEYVYEELKQRFEDETFELKQVGDEIGAWMKEGIWSYDNNTLLADGSGEKKGFYVDAIHNGILYARLVKRPNHYGFRITRLDEKSEKENEATINNLFSNSAQKNNSLVLSDMEQKMIGEWETIISGNVVHFTFYEDGYYKESSDSSKYDYPLAEWCVADDMIILVGDHDAKDGLWHFITIEKFSDSHFTGVYSWDTDNTIDFVRKQEYRD